MNRPGDIVWATCDRVMAVGGVLTYSPKCGTEKRRPWLMLGVLGDHEVWVGLSTTPHTEAIDIPQPMALGLRRGTHALAHCVVVLPSAALASEQVTARLYEGRIPVGLLVGAREAVADIV